MWKNGASADTSHRYRPLNVLEAPRKTTCWAPDRDTWETLKTYEICSVICCCDDRNILYKAYFFACLTKRLSETFTEVTVIKVIHSFCLSLLVFMYLQKYILTSNCEIQIALYARIGIFDKPRLLINIFNNILSLI